MSSRKKADTQAQAEAITAEVKATMEPVSTALEVQQPAGALVTFEIDEADMGVGHEERRREDNTVPMLLVLQSKSPIVETCTDGSVRAGMLINTLSKRVYDPAKQKIELAIGCYHTKIVEWIPRESGGGFVGERDPDDEEFRIASQIAREKKGGKLVPKVPINNGHELIETFTAFGAIRIDGEEVEAIAIPCTSTKLKPIRNITQDLMRFRLRTGVDGAAPGPFYFSLGVRTEMEKRGNNLSYNFRFAPINASGDGPVWDAASKTLVVKPTKDGLRASMLPKGDPLMETAKAVAQGVRAGLLKADNEGAVKAGEGGGGAAGDGDSDIPF